LKKLALGILFISLIHAGYSQPNKSFISDYYRLLDDSTFSAGQKRFHKTRYEGLSKTNAVFEFGRYIKKYKHKRLNASQDDVSHFRCQKLAASSQRSNGETEKSLKLALVGDIMWIGKPNHNYVSNDVVNYLNGFDMVIGNLETPIDKTKRTPNILPDYFTYNSNPTLVDAFKDSQSGKSPFTLLSLSNNHTLDRGADGIINTMKYLDEEGINHTGVSLANSNGKIYSCVTQNDIKIGLYSATYGLNFEKPSHLKKLNINHLHGLAPPNASKVCINQISEALKQMHADSVDIKIISLHWGYEFELYPDSLVRIIAKQIVEAGADIILGSHPHVFQPFEVYYLNGYADSANPLSCINLATDSIGQPRKAIVFYSLGNFVTRMFTPACQIGVIVSLQVQKDNEIDKTSWNGLNMDFVYNKVPLFPGKNHRLMFYDSYRHTYLAKPNRKSKRILREAEFMINHINNKL
jgi:poly-gamma-glutamate capsule biosynthesis protein CapA/YwtB (metallophosphatase superfamily)